MPGNKPRGPGPLVCCDICGRDTRSKSGICARCMAGGTRHDEQRGRAQLRHTRDTYADPFDEVDDDDIGGHAAGSYHGDTIRDDL